MPNVEKVVAIDCGGTNLRVAVVDKELNVLAVERVPSIANNIDLLYKTMKSLIDKVTQEAGLETVSSIGVSMCGVVVHNKIGRVGNLGIDSNFDLEGLLKKDFPNAKVLIANDGNCSALVEAEYGVNKGFKDSAFVTISTGIGLGVVHCGEMIDLPLEAGRMMTEYHNKIYETEGLLSGTGIVKLAALHGLKIQGGADFFAGVKEKKEDYLKVYNVWTKKLGLWFANLQLLFDVSQYALSGGVMKSKDVWVTDVERIANAAIAPWKFNKVVFKEAKYGQDVGIAAAGCLAWHVLNKD